MTERNQSVHGILYASENINIEELADSKQASRYNQVIDQENKIITTYAGSVSYDKFNWKYFCSFTKTCWLPELGPSSRRFNTIDEAIEFQRRTSFYDLVNLDHDDGEFRRKIWK